jgi:EAL domain-containing protein (putative c-di-GMP-specific phosphodiesterase class I)
VPPADFIPLAEETNLIIPMSEWAIRAAARQARRWMDEFGFNGSIAVNLPARMFGRTDLVDLITTATREEGVPQSMLQLEVTENKLMEELQRVLPTLHRLTEIGVRISIDDFGTGYSSLAYLGSMPIAEVKIDRTFVRDLLVKPEEAKAIVSVIIALAQTLKFNVIAEGVETAHQLEILRSLGCELMQGFLFSKPMPPDQMARWIEDVILPRKAAWFSRTTPGPVDPGTPVFAGAARGVTFDPLEPESEADAILGKRY